MKRTFAFLFKADTPHILFRIFREHGRQNLRSYLISFLFMAIGAAATAWASYLLKPVLNHMVEGDDFRKLRTLSWMVAGLFTIRGLATYGYLVLLSRTGNRIIASVQKRLFTHLVWQDLTFFQNRHSSEFITRLAIAANGVRDGIQTLVTSFGRDALTLIGLMGVMLFQDPIMSAIVLLVMPIAIVTLTRLIKRVRKFAWRSFSGSTQILQILQETILGIKMVKSFNLEETMQTRMQCAVEEVEKSANHMSAGAAISSPIADTLAGIAIAAVIFYGSWRVTIAHADPGSFFAFVAALLMAYDPAKRLARLNLDLQHALTGARLIYEILDMPLPETGEGKQPEVQVSRGEIVFKDVCFGYVPQDPVLHKFNLVIRPHATTALVGPSGGGKTTILGLIQRFYAPQSGQILLDEQDIAHVSLPSLRQRIAFVSQDAFLFQGSIWDNIALGREGASKDEIIEAARKAYAHDFISAFSNGYETNVGEQGFQLSGGQRQRIAIARALLKDAPLLLLDEPTAALDSDSEREVQRALEELQEGRTTLVVAHRLQTILSADHICVIQAGQCVEQGTHAELLAQRGTYHSFFATQFGG